MQAATRPAVNSSPVARCRQEAALDFALGFVGALAPSVGEGVGDLPLCPAQARGHHRVEDAAEEADAGLKNGGLFICENARGGVGVGHGASPFRSQGGSGVSYCCCSAIYVELCIALGAAQHIPHAHTSWGTLRHLGAESASFRTVSASK